MGHLNWSSVRQSVGSVNALLIETDSPYLTPEPFRGKRNEPSYVRNVAECVATVRDISLGRLAEITIANAHQRFCV